MSLNWKEIDLILSELNLKGGQIQKAVQSSFDILALQIHNRGKTLSLLIALTPGACRLHETRRPAPRSDKPLRFAEFLKSRIVNGWIDEARQLGRDRIIRIRLHRGEERLNLYIRLWSNAANVIVTGEDGRILDAMRRSPKRGEVSGASYAPEESPPSVDADKYEIRNLGGGTSFNEEVDRYYAEQGGALSLESLREQARRTYNGSIGRLSASLEKLRAKRESSAAAGSLRQYGDLIMANLDSIKEGQTWLEADNFYSGGTARIKLDPAKTGPAQAEQYYRQYRKAKTGLGELDAQIRESEEEIARLEKTLETLLTETNPLKLHKLLRTGAPRPRRQGSPKRPGLAFRRGDWLILVGRDAKENGELLRRHVKGNDLWLHVRDHPGSYVFIKQRSGKSYPLDILLDAGNLALFYSKARGEKAADLFYTPVKYLRRPKTGTPGLVIPSQEKNLRITLDVRRLRELEKCRVE
jgi:predicted ribosome quality control (RQC) complex YloA/Tae2 family protein